MDVFLGGFKQVRRLNKKISGKNMQGRKYVNCKEGL